MIRRATNDDANELVRLTRLYLLESPHQKFIGEVSDDQIIDVMQTCLLLGDVLVSEENSRLTGMLALVPVTHLLNGVLYIEDFVWFIEKRERGLRLANRFIDEAANVTRQRHAPMLKMTSPASSGVSLLLTRKGFREVETVYLLDVSP